MSTRTRRLYCLTCRRAGRPYRIEALSIVGEHVKLYCSGCKLIRYSDTKAARHLWQYWQEQAQREA